MLSARPIASASCLGLSSKRSHYLAVSAYSMQMIQWPSKKIHEKRRLSIKDDMPFQSFSPLDPRSLTRPISAHKIQSKKVVDE